MQATAIQTGTARGELTAGRVSLCPEPAANVIPTFLSNGIIAAELLRLTGP